MSDTDRPDAGNGVGPITLDDREVQALRISVMMYRQGWLDAAEWLQGETMRKTRELHKQYQALL